ncbi:MAG: hypothetical protein RJA55_2315 [Acidobacteriota bacterium]|jgi:hypothetical protein
MGLLDFLGAGIDDPKTAASLALAQGLLSGRGGAQGLLQGMQGYTGTLAAAREAARRQQMEERAAALQEALAGLRVDEAKAAAAQRLKAEAQSGVDTAAMRDQFAPLPGPTQDGSGLAPLFDPRRMLGQGASPQAVQQALGLQAAMQKPEVPLLKGSPGDAFFDPRNPKGGPVFSVPAKPPEDPTSWREYTKAQGDAQFANWLKEQANLKTPRTTVNVPVNLGQKGFDNTLKLRGDFRSEPVYKAHQEMQSAYSQIGQSLKQASPAGDLAGATKIMKLLDPGSVVRESELGMAMAASGLLDRVQNYASNIMAGTKLTPTQRADFQRLADALYAESVKQYNAKRTEYQGIAERNSLSVPDVLGSPSAAPGTPGDWSIKRVP